jgi:hypothetical protein
MTKQRILWTLTLFGVVLAVGCGKKESETTEETTPATEQQATPIDQSTVGEITGKISFEGEKAKLAVIHMDQDPVCVEKHQGQTVHVEDGEVNANGTLPNAFVYVKEGAEKYTFPTPTEPVTLDQNGCLYRPHVLGIMVGQDLHIISSDPTTHNIHPMPKNNQEWNNSQAPGAGPLDKKFARPEIMIPVKCNQHPWMRAYIGVMKNPFYAVSGAEGTYTLKGLPPGDYTIEAWAVLPGGNMQTQDQKVTVGPKETKTADFAFKAS